MSKPELEAAYRARHETALVATAEHLKRHLDEHLSGLPRVDRITTRAKDPDRFLEKAGQQENGHDKYEDPLNQIQDQLGARIVTFFRDDVTNVAEELKRYYRHIEEQTLIPDSEWSFGYFGLHYILALPRDVVPETVDREQVPRFFEVQIKTLFQHAWSEANHDLGYKPVTALTADQQRRLAFTAAQAWGADEIFVRLYHDLAGTSA